jgi:ppGpp synthetase/RelA/SpoT-type nucleotidyltranferase
MPSLITNKDQRPELSTYTQWLVDALSIDPSSLAESTFQTASSRIKDSFSSSSFWKDLTSQHKDWNQEYFIKTGYYLFAGTQNVPDLIVKPFSSFINKTYRSNILNNRKWPNPPKLRDTEEKAWIQPNNWFETVNDVVRTTFVVNYLDGVQYLADILVGLAKQSDLKHHLAFEARDEGGYYAAHLYIYITCEIPTEDFQVKTITCPIEIQIKTQLQEFIKNITHKYYEDRRSIISIIKKENEVKWQWDYKSEEFKVNYLGNILHYLEGMIVEIREQRSRKEKQ